MAATHSRKRHTATPPAHHTHPGVTEGRVTRHVTACRDPSPHCARPTGQAGISSHTLSWGSPCIS